MSYRKIETLIASGLIHSIACVAIIACADSSGPVSPDGTQVKAISSAPFHVKDLTVGALHACAVTGDGDIYCWGNNSFGELGDSTFIDHWAPVRLAGSWNFKGLSSGGGGNCALDPAGKAYCWGWNARGAIGDGTTTDRATPTAVSTTLTFRSVAAEGLHSCGIATDGYAYCWGYNAWGELGDGTNTDRTTPVLVSGGIRFENLFVGGDITCGITVDFRAYCWGSGGRGELGDGTRLSRNIPAPVEGNLRFRMISISNTGYHICGITVDGSAYCWGSNRYGQSGDGTYSDDRLEPVAVKGGFKFTSIALGSYHVCAITEAGYAYCWGSGVYSELGAGNLSESPSPVPIIGSEKFRAIGAGNLYTCGITVQDVAMCWGRVLGDGTTNHSSAPVNVHSP
jgi:alpha-tubulin suppressor-like RCC1 family protein